MTAPPRATRPVPTLKLPLPPRRAARTVVASVVLHAAVLALVAVAGLAQLGSGGGSRGGGSGGRGGGKDRVNFFVLPAGSPTAVALETPPPLAVASLPALARIKVDVPAVEVPHDTITRSALANAAGLAGAGQAGGAGAGAGQGQGTGAGAGVGPGAGTGDAGDYIFVASPRTAILPPLAKVPGSVAGRTYRVRFSVAADGRVTQVEVDPSIDDATYRREFMERMQGYRFYPARTRDGRPVASVVTVPLHIGH